MGVIHSGLSAAGSGEPLCWCGPDLFLSNPAKGGASFTCVTPISVNSLRRKTARGHNEWGERDCTLNLRPELPGGSDNSRGESRPQICLTVADGLLTDCSPPLPCGHGGRRSSFSIRLPFCLPHREETYCTCLGNGGGNRPIGRALGFLRAGYHH